MTADDWKAIEDGRVVAAPGPWRITWSTAWATSTRRSPRPSGWAARTAPRSCSSSAGLSHPLDLRDHAERADPGGHRPFQLPGARPEQGADVPLPLAARPDRLPAGRAMIEGGGPIEPGEWPVLVTGASGFVGGHVARELARAGYPVRGLTRRPPVEREGDPPIDWIVGDLRESADRRRAIANVRGVVHSASWVSLGSDPRGVGAAVNVGATRGLLADAIAAGVERFVYTSTLHTLAAGSAEAPADEFTPWNLDHVRSPYERTKREAEAIILDGLGGKLPGVALCPGMVIGPRDPKPTSTSLLALDGPEPGGVPARGRDSRDRRPGGCARPPSGARIGRAGATLRTGRPLSELRRPGPAGRPGLGLAEGGDAVAGPPGTALFWAAGVIDRLSGGRWIEVSKAAVAGGFLRLHVRGDRADAAFGLEHRPPIVSVYEALEDARRSGMAPRLRLRRPEELARREDRSIGRRLRIALIGTTLSPPVALAR